MFSIFLVFLSSYPPPHAIAVMSSTGVADLHSLSFLPVTLLSSICHCVYV